MERITWWVGTLCIRLFPRRGTTSCPDPLQKPRYHSHSHQLLSNFTNLRSWREAAALQQPKDASVARAVAEEQSWLSCSKYNLSLSVPMHKVQKYQYTVRYSSGIAGGKHWLLGPRGRSLNWIDPRKGKSAHHSNMVQKQGLVLFILTWRAMKGKLERKAETEAATQLCTIAKTSKCSLSSYWASLYGGRSDFSWIYLVTGNTIYFLPLFQVQQCLLGKSLASAPAQR